MPAVHTGTVTALLFDVHIPEHSTPAVKAALEVISYVKPQRIVYGGDILDCPQISSFVQNPITASRIENDRDELALFLDTVKKRAPQAEQIWLDGNHEDRWRKYLATRAPELAGLKELRPENFFGLKERGIKWHPYGAKVMIDGVLATHGNVVRKFAGYTGKAMFEKYRTSGVSGHVHRGAIYRERSYSGDGFWMEVPCLCDLDPEYINDVANWQQGMGLLYHKRGWKTARPELVSIVDGQAMMGGRCFG